MGIPFPLILSLKSILKNGTRVGASLLFFFGLAAFAEQPDSIKLTEVTVTTDKPVIRTLTGGNLRVNFESLRSGSRVLGEADVMNSLKRVAGISSVGDYGSGLIVQGSDPSQTLFQIDGAPVFFPYRFGGVFSTFNSTHFTSATLLRSGRNGASPSRLGATVNLAPALNYDKRVGGALNAGLLASAITLQTSVNKKFALTASGRVSYIDQLYGRLLKHQANTLAYQFYDINLVAGWRIDSLNTLTANYFRNADFLNDDNSRYSMQTQLRWRNNVASIRWQSLRAEATAYISEFSSRMNVNLPQFGVTSRSRIIAYGVTGSYEIARKRRCSLRVGIDFNGVNVTPLWGTLGGELSRESADHDIQKCFELRAYVDSKFLLSENLTLCAGISASTFSGRFLALDPRLTLDWRRGNNLWTFSAGVFSQYLHLVGFSELGLASNFWFASQGDIRPQRSIDLSVSWQRPLFGGEVFLSATVYGKRVLSQSEYRGQVLDLVSPTFDPRHNILTANGYNAGAELSLQKRFGPITADLGYSFGYAVRRHNGRWVRSLTDTGHQLKLNAGYEINSHWNIAAAFTFASGRVYTPTRYLYLISGNVMTEYGAHNSARLPSYQRLDLSATYRVRRHSLNLSLLNAYGRRNVEIQYFGVNAESGEYQLIRESSLYRFLPSISYSFEF